MSKIRKSRKMAAAFIIFVIIFAVFAVSVSANSAEPPAVTIIVLNPTDGMSCELIGENGSEAAYYKKTAWAGYFNFYYHQLSGPGEYRLAVTSGGETYELELPDGGSGYRSIYTLDAKARTLTPVEYPARAVTLAGIRMGLTFLVEGLIFYLFGYREKRSWIVFFAVNLITQGLLNLALNMVDVGYGTAHLMFIFGEFYVFLAEMIITPPLIKEKKFWKTLLYALAANTASFIAGWIIITKLPV